MPVGASVDMEGVADLSDNLEAAGQTLRRKLAEKVETAANAGRNHAIKQLTRKQSGYGEGLLRQTIQIRKHATPEDLEAIVSAGGGKTTEDGFDYSLAVEFGTRPHFPPVKAVTGNLESLDVWVRRMNPSPKTGAQQNMTQDELNEEVAFLIARKISRVGTKEMPFMRPGFNIARATLRKEIQGISLDR